MNEQTLAQAVFGIGSMREDIAEIKATMRELAAAVTRLAVIEERQVHDRAEISRVFKTLAIQDGRLNLLEQAQPLNSRTNRWVEKGLIFVIGAVISAVLALVIVSKAPAGALPNTYIEAK